MNLENGGHQTAMITDLATKTTDILLVEQQMYIEHKAGQLPARGPGSGAQELKPYDAQNPCANQPDVTCKKIGVEEVSGRTCDHWQITDKQDRVTDLWIDQKLSFPVKVTTKDSMMLLTNVKEGQPEASLFEIPAGYHKLDMSGMLPPGAAARRTTNLCCRRPVPTQSRFWIGWGRSTFRGGFRPTFSPDQTGNSFPL